MPGAQLNGKPQQPPRRRALIMAGGGLKVAYEAGVMQVWLDEAGIEFAHADGCSGGVLNLAMWCQGMTGTQIADKWRAYRPLLAGTPNVRGLFRGTSLLSFGGMKKWILPGFGLDWHAIRSTAREATFNVFNVSRQEHQVLSAARMNEDMLLAGIALPMWFPPGRINGDTYIDAVFATDANLEEAIQRGATELWVVWTVSTRGQWRPGFVSQYFTMIEAVANSRLRTALNRIERSNAALAAGKPAEFGHKVSVHLMAKEVPLHYLLNFRRSNFVEAVDMGIRDARAWCKDRGIPTRPVAEPAPSPSAVDSVSFHEVMTGTISRKAGQPARMSLELDIVIKDTERFVSDPEHLAAVFGFVRCPALGGQLPIRQGSFNVLVDSTANPQPTKLMVYDLQVTDFKGRTLDIHGEKTVRHDVSLDLWPDTTTLATQVRTGDRVVAAGILRITVAGLLRQLASFRATASTPAEQAEALARFGTFFLGHLWEVYRRRAAPTNGLAMPRWLRKVAAR
jgi:predicted acylesterase/phospholipase RssA